EDLDRPKTVERDDLIHTKHESHRAAWTGAQLGPFAEFHSLGGLGPWGIRIRARLHDSLYTGDGDFERAFGECQALINTWIDARHRRGDCRGGRRESDHGKKCAQSDKSKHCWLP